MNEKFLCSRLAPHVASYLWHHSQPIAGTLAERYLRETLGLSRSLPEILGYCHRAWCQAHQDYSPALIAPIEDKTAPETPVAAVVQTFLCQDTLGPWRAADGAPLTETFGNPGAGAVRLAPCDTTLGLAATVEAALAATQEFSLPVWAAGDVERLNAVALPTGLERLVIFADREDWAAASAAQTAARGYRDFVPHVAIQHMPSIAVAA